MKTNENQQQMQFKSAINTIDQQCCLERFPMHWHKYVEIIAIPEEAKEEERVIILLNQVEYKLFPGDILIIWPGELHEIIDNISKKMLVLQFPITVLNENKDFARFMHIFRNHNLLSYLDTPELNQTMFFFLKQIFLLKNDEEKYFKNVEMLICLYEMFITLGNFLQDKWNLFQSLDKHDESMMDKMQMVCQYIQENCETNLSLENVSEYVGFSPCYFSRCFKKATAYSFVEYLMMQRVKRMQMLLKDNELSITDAAYQAGFKSISTLNRVFKQYCGCSPSEYIKYYTTNV